MELKIKYNDLCFSEQDKIKEFLKENDIDFEIEEIKDVEFCLGEHLEIVSENYSAEEILEVYDVEEFTENVIMHYELEELLEIIFNMPRNKKITQKRLLEIFREKHGK